MVQPLQYGGHQMEGGEDSVVSASRGGGEAPLELGDVAATSDVTSGIPSGIPSGITSGITSGIPPPITGVSGDEKNVQLGESPPNVPPLGTPSMDEEDKYGFLSYSNYFFLEEPNYVNTYFDVKDILKNTNPTLTSFFKYIALLSHVIYFDQVEEKKLLTSTDVQNIKHILLKNEQSNITSDTVAYSCIVLLLDVIKLSPHSGIKNYVYCQLAKNAQKIENLFFPIYSYQKGKHRDHSYVVRKNEAIFISDFVTLNVINLLNGEDKLTRNYGLRLCLLFRHHLSGCNHLVHIVLRIIFKKINFDEFTLALLVLTKWTPFLSHDVLYHVVRGLYHSAVGRSSRREIPTAGKHTTGGASTEKLRQRDVGGSPPDGCTDGEVNQAEKQRHTQGHTQSYTQTAKLHVGETKKGPILDNPFTFTISMYLAKIANRMNDMFPYVSYFLFRKLWKMINSLFSEEEKPCASEEAAITILRAYFHSTTILSHQNGFLTNLQIISIKFLLMVPQTTLMKRRQLTYFALKSLLFLMKKKSIHVFPFVDDISGKRNSFDQRVSSFHFSYFSFVSTIREYEVVAWLNRLPLCRGDSPALFMFVKIVYQFFKAASGENYLTRSERNGGSILPRLANHCKGENSGEVIAAGNHPNRFQMNILPSLSRAHRDPFIHNFVCTLRESLPIEMYHPDGYPKWDDKFTPDYAMEEKEHLPVGSGGDQLASPPHKENSNQGEEKKRSSCENDSTGGEERGQFCFTITLSDSGGSDDRNDSDDGGVRDGCDTAEEHFPQESMSKLAKPDGRTRQRRMDLFFERFVQLAKENEKASDINVKKLDITLKIRGGGGPHKGEQHHREERQQGEQQKEERLEEHPLQEDPEAERETHSANERTDQAEGERVKTHHPRRESNPPPKREDGTLLNSRQPKPNTGDQAMAESEKSSLSDAISEISNGQNSPPKKNTIRDLLYTQVKTDKQGEIRKKNVFPYCYKWLKKNKIRLQSFVSKDKLEDFTFGESFFAQFKKAFLKKKKKKYSRPWDRRGVNRTYDFGQVHDEREGSPSGEDIPDDSTLYRVMFIRLLFFLNRHSSDSVSIKMCIFKTLTILGKYIVYDEDVREFVHLLNSFFHIFVHNKGDSNVDTHLDGVANSELIGETCHTSNNVSGMSRGTYIEGRPNFNYRRGSKYTHSGTDLNHDDRLYTVRGIGGHITSSDLETRDETNSDLFLSDLLHRRLRDPPGESGNCTSYQQSGAFKSAMQTCLLSVAANLGNCTNGHLLNCLFHSFCSNEFVPFFHLLFTLRAEKIVHILRDPFFYLLIDCQETKGDYSPRGKADEEYGMSSNRVTEGAKKTKKKTSFDTLVSRVKGGRRVYFLKRSKFFQTFNICQHENDHPASYHNVRHLFHLALVSYGKGQEVSAALRRKVYVFLSQVNSPSDGNQVWEKENQRGGPRVGWGDTRGEAGAGQRLPQGSNSGESAIDQETHPRRGSGGGGDRYSSSGRDSTDSNGTSDTPPSTCASSDDQPSSAERDHPSDCSSISSMSNKSLRRKVQKMYRKLQHQEKVASEENVQVANLKKNENSLFYLYRSGKYCMCAGFYKHGYSIFGKLFVVANSGDVKLWFRVLLNYCNFFCRKRRKSYGDWKTFLSSTKFLLISEQCMKEIRIFQQNFFLFGFFLKVQINMYRAVEDLLTLVSDIRDEINFTLTYFVCNIERIITSLVETTLGILTLAGIRHSFAGLSKRVLFLYVVFLKSTFVLCSFLRHKVIPFLFLSPSFVLRAPPVDSGTDSNGSSGGGSSGEGSNVERSSGEGSNVERSSVRRNGERSGRRRAVFNIGSCILHDLVHFYLNKSKIRRMRNNIFAKEMTDTQGKNFPDVFDYVMTLWRVAACKFFFYEHVQKIKELYHQFFKDGMVNKKKILAFMKIYLEVFYRMDLPTPPRVFSSVAVPYVSSSTYVYRSIKGRAPSEVESLKCVGQLVSHKAATVRDFHYCNVKLILSNKVIREVNVRNEGINITYTAHIKMAEDEWKDFAIFLTPLDGRKRLLGQAKATVLYFKYV
ncbi:hypothetical protein C922_02925 [Plasmodium inui San Antonio 1]|uniref:Uncharacterized protein n=1 Tax=Plasmodium inui San Antonio 1 TaxID=1237626 RepID=W7AC07_9APIC|nr:hypothetical protein C922_02925 [Plasmodium inui San Antonio 1]EUD66604.1 hypothetical protein C922_02925 [Plasmodium inui San Antonio 1]